MEAGRDSVQLAELVAAVSLVADHASGVPLEHGLRSCFLAQRLAERAGLDGEVCRDVFYVSLLRAIGCTSDAHEQAALFGDEIAARRDLNLAAHLSPRELVGALGRHAGSGLPPLQRARVLARTLASGNALPRRIAAAHCEAAERFANRLGAGSRVAAALRRQFERWDGKGYPAGLRGEEIPLAARFTQVAYDALLLQAHTGAVERVRSAGGTLYDPAVVRLLAPDDATDVAGLLSPWEAALALEPGGPTPLSDEQLDGACRAAADFADLKSPWLLGHSSAVAELAEAAGWRLRLPAAEVATLRRGALLHDLGRAAVSSGVWDRAGPLDTGDWELVRLHPYHAERALTRSAALEPFGALAGLHHERLDGSGYHRGAMAPQLGTAARVLAASDAYQAMTEPRPHRPPLAPEQAADELEAGVRAGRLDGEAVGAVLASAGQRARRPRRAYPAGLSEREVAVLCLLARGHRNREIAARLGIAPKTVGHHVQHVYAKIRVSTRATAALYALEHELLRE